MTTSTRSLTGLMLALAWATSAAAVDAPPRSSFVLTHVNLIDATGAPALRDASVAVVEGKIVAAGPAGKVVAPAGAKVVDGSGKTLIPGLWDMHVHFSMKPQGRLFVANGVTGVRVMWGLGMKGGAGQGIQQRFRASFADGLDIGPRMVIAGNIVDGPNPIWPGSTVAADAAGGVKAVDEAKAAGADFVKVYTLLPADAFRAIAAECRAQGIPFAGHVPNSVSAAEASALGQRSMEHLYGLASACSSRGDELREKMAAEMRSGKSLADLKPMFRVMSLANRESFDEAKAAAFFATLKANNTYQCPTLTVLHHLGHLQDPALTQDDPRLKYVSTFMKTFWNPKNDFRFKDYSPADFAILRADYDAAGVMVGRLHRAGVPILAGTDEANPYCIPGFSLHDELAFLVGAGLSPMDALQAATRNPARFLGREAEAGTIEVGKQADLVLLDADPLVDIRNTTKIRAVVADGRYYDREALDAILSAAEVPVKPKVGATGHVEAPAVGFCIGH